MKGAHIENGKLVLAGSEHGAAGVEARAHEYILWYSSGCSPFVLQSVHSLTHTVEGTENLNQASIIPSDPSESVLTSLNKK